MMREAWANGLDVMKTFSGLFNSPGFAVLAENAEVQKRILSAYPLLKAFNGFKDITDASTNDQVGPCERMHACGPAGRPACLPLPACLPACLRRPTTDSIEPHYPLPHP